MVRFFWPTLYINHYTVQYNQCYILMSDVLIAMADEEKLTKFGTLRFQGFGPEATESVPVSVLLHSAEYSMTRLDYIHR